MRFKFRYGFLIGAALFGLGIAAASALLYRQTLPHPNEVSDDIAEEFEDKEKYEEYTVKMKPVADLLETQKPETVYIRSWDHLRLHGLLLPAENPNGRLVIFHHGFTSNALDNGTHAKFFHELGYHVLLLDLRAHGESEGQYVGFGIMDRYDTVSWVRWAKERFGDQIKIVLHGTSMGGATVLMSLGFEEIQNDISAVIADCAYTSPTEVFSYVIKNQYHIPVNAPFIWIYGIYTRSKARYAFSDYSTLTALKNNKVPVLFIHGGDDLFVPTYMSLQNYDESPSKKELLIVENAGHGSSVFVNTELYQETEKKFLDEVFSQN